MLYWTSAPFRFPLNQLKKPCYIVRLMVDMCFALKKVLLFIAYGREGVKMNFIDRIFIGELTSTVMCEECANVGILEITSIGINYNHIIFIVSFTYSHQWSFVFIHDYVIYFESLFKIYPLLLGGNL